MNKNEKERLIQEAGRSVIHRKADGTTVFDVGDLLRAFEDRGVIGKSQVDTVGEWLDEAERAEAAGEIDRAEMCIRNAREARKQKAKR